MTVERLFEMDKVTGRVKAFYLYGQVIEYDSLHIAIIESRKQ